MSLVPWSRESGFGMIRYRDGVRVDEFRVEYLWGLWNTHYTVIMTPQSFFVAGEHGARGARSMFDFNDADRIKYHNIVLNRLSKYKPFYVAVKQVMRKLPSELERRVYEFM